MVERWIRSHDLSHVNLLFKEMDTGQRDVLVSLPRNNRDACD
jgi:hypothetical protein